MFQNEICIKSGKFTLEIEMGNDAMQTTEDIIDALKQVIKKMESGRDGGFIQDVNGNNVGTFEIK